MHNIKFIQRRFPQQSNLIIAGLAIASLLGIVGGLLLLLLP